MRTVSKDGYIYENDEEVRGGDYKNMYQHYENDEEVRKTGYNYKNAEEVRKGGYNYKSQNHSIYCLSTSLQVNLSYGAQ